MEENKLALVKEPLRTSFRQLIDRCEKAGIKHDLEEFLEEDYYLRIYLPSGRDKRTVSAFDSEDVQKLNQTEFEKYVFVPGYRAICSYEIGLIEAYVRFLTPSRTDLALGRLLDITYKQVQEMSKENLVFELGKRASKGNPLTITISYPSNTMLALDGRGTDSSERLTIRISGLVISNTEEASAILEGLANSLLLQIQILRDIPLMLEPYQEPNVSRWWVSSQRSAKKSPITFPKYRYDLEPLNLYWYAVSAYAMPLLQFLAYYQVLEFYFPIYSQQEVQREVATIIKDPNFNPEHHLDMNKVISAVLSKMGRGYSDEKGQMRITIKACVQDAEIRELMRSDYIEEHFKGDYKKLSMIKVSIDKDSDLREQLADRLYDIRCSVVHTKAEERERKRILPFTKEEGLLKVEVDIIEFIARKALTAASKRLDL